MLCYNMLDIRQHMYVYGAAGISQKGYTKMSTMDLKIYYNGRRNIP